MAILNDWDGKRAGQNFITRSGDKTSYSVRCGNWFQNERVRPLPPADRIGSITVYSNGSGESLYLTGFTIQDQDKREIFVSGWKGNQSKETVVEQGERIVGIVAGNHPANSDTDPVNGFHTEF